MFRDGRNPNLENKQRRLDVLGSDANQQKSAGSCGFSIPRKKGGFSIMLLN
jgi:hypothetical protein